MREHLRFRGQIRYILVVDPDVNERLTLSMLLQRFGYTIASASNAREVLEFLCVAPAVAVFANAGATGDDLLERLSEDARFREVPVVLMTESMERGLEEKVRRSEIAGVVRKPFDADDIFMVIQKVIEKGSRKNIRIATSLPAVLKDGADSNKGYVTVLSQYGMFFRTLEQRSVNARVAVEVPIWERTVRLEAKVLYTVSFEDGPFREPGIGMKIVKIGPEDSALIKAFILDQISEGIIALDPGPGFRGGYA